MGCGSGQREVTGPVRINTVTGKLKITITNATIFHEASVFKMDPYITLKLSNQEKRSKTIVKGGKQPSFLESFQFFINSCFKVHGRNLEMTVMDQKKVGSDNQIGFGIVDLDPIVNFKKPKEQFRCFINYERKLAGFVNIIAEFSEEQARALSFRFQTASIRRKTSTFGSMNCWVQITLGEEVLQTEKCKDTKETPPTWLKDILTFNIAQSITQCVIKVYDDQEVVGSLDMNIKDLLASKQEQSFNEEFQFDNEVNAGTLKFQTIVGINPQFSEIKTVHKKPKEKKEDKDKKEEDKKQEETKKEEPKKEQPVKEEPKKEEPPKEEPKQQPSNVIKVNPQQS